MDKAKEELKKLMLELEISIIKKELEVYLNDKWRN